MAPGVQTAWAENIDPDNDGSQYAYGENVGWLNAEPSGDGGPGVEVGSAMLTGYLWAENVGWLSLSCLNTSSCATVNYGVANNGAGVLSGYAWGENVGWLNFAPTGGGVAIDPCTGDFSGRAWGENIGWVTFSSAGPVPYRVTTGWVGQNTVTANANGNGTGNVASNTGGINYNYPANNTGTTTPINCGTNVVVTAAAGAGSTATWNGTCTGAGGAEAGNGTGTATCTFASLDGNKTATATFTLNQYTVTANANGTGAGTVQSNVGGINYNYPANNTGTTTPINYGTNVVVTAAAGAGSTATWGGTCTGAGGAEAGNGTGTATCTFASLNGNKTVTATFTAAVQSCLRTAPVPTGPTNVGTFPPGLLLDENPGVMRPFGLQELDGMLNGWLGLPCWWNGNVDIYVIVTTSPYGQLVLNNFHRWLPFPANVVPWLANTTDDVYTQLFSYAKSGLLPGSYRLEVVVVPSGTPASTIQQIVAGTSTAPFYQWSFTKTLP